MKKAFFVLVVVIVMFNYSYLEAMFFSHILKTDVNQNKTCSIDFAIDGNFTDSQVIDLNEYEEKEIDLNFDVVNNGDCGVFIRVAVLPVILGDDANTYYKLNNSSFRFRYINEDESALNTTYWQDGDTYTFYKKELKEGERLENNLISGIVLNLNREDAMMISGKKLKLAIKVESVQSKYNAYEKAWNI